MSILKGHLPLDVTLKKRFVWEMSGAHSLCHFSHQAPPGRRSGQCCPHARAHPSPSTCTVGPAPICTWSPDWGSYPSFRVHLCCCLALISDPRLLWPLLPQLVCLLTLPINLPLGRGLLPETLIPATGTPETFPTDTLLSTAATSPLLPIPSLWLPFLMWWHLSTPLTISTCHLPGWASSASCSILL